MRERHVPRAHSIMPTHQPPKSPNNQTERRQKEFADQESILRSCPKLLVPAGSAYDVHLPVVGEKPRAERVLNAYRITRQIIKNKASLPSFLLNRCHGIANISTFVSQVQTTARG